LESLIPPRSSEGGEKEVEIHEGDEELNEAPEFGAAPKEQSHTTSTPRSEHIFYIETDKITPNPHQPRREFNEDELNALAQSIRQYGVLQPLVVTKKEIDMPYGRRVEYELLAGERRLRASKLAGFRHVPAIIREADDREKLEMALIENVQREDLNPIEEAEAYKKLADTFSLTQEDIATRVGKSREVVANKQRLPTLPREVQQYIADDLITEGHGKVLLSVENPERVRMLAKEAIKNAWSVRALEARLKKREDAPGLLEKEQDPQLEHYRKLVEEQLGTQVSFSGSHEKGRLAITFHSHDDLEKLIARLAGADVSPGETTHNTEPPVFEDDGDEAFTV